VLTPSDPICKLYIYMYIFTCIARCVAVPGGEVRERRIRTGGGGGGGAGGHTARLLKSGRTPTVVYRTSPH
jgi:hypothetical protein